MSSPRYVWPLIVSAAIAAREVRRWHGDDGDAAAALLDRLRTVAAKLEAFGPVQRAWQLSFAALDPRGGACADDNEGTAAEAADPLAAADDAAAAWEALGQPYPAAVALRYAAAAALDGPAGREAAMARLRRAAPIAERLGARPLADEIADLASRAGDGQTASRRDQDRRVPARPHRPRVRGPPARRGRSVEP